MVTGIRLLPNPRPCFGLHGRECTDTNDDGSALTEHKLANQKSTEFDFVLALDRGVARRRPLESTCRMISPSLRHSSQRVDWEVRVETRPTLHPRVSTFDSSAIENLARRAFFRYVVGLLQGTGVTAPLCCIYRTDTLLHLPINACGMLEFAGGCHTALTAYPPLFIYLLPFAA